MTEDQKKELVEAFARLDQVVSIIRFTPGELSNFNSALITVKVLVDKLFVPPKAT